MVGAAANINFLLILNLENSLKISDVSVLLFKKKNRIPVSTSVLLVVSNSLCSFPGNRKSLLKDHLGFLVLLLSVFSRFHFALWNESNKRMCSLCKSVYK